MGWSIGYDRKWQRDIGYGVPSVCDHPGCNEQIDRGLSYVCGGEPFGGEHGCGLHFCGKHLLFAGAKRSHAQLCSRCYSGKGGYHTPKQDTPEWINWKLTDESWQKWRDENPGKIEMLKKLLSTEAQPE